MSSYYPKNFLRTNCYCSDFCDILFRNYVNAKEIKNNIDATFDYDNLLDKRKEMVRHSTSSVIFSIMIVEAFINDYLAAVLGDEKYYEKYDFLSLENKINLCFDFIFKKNLKKDSGFFQLFCLINKMRNSFVHSKSKSFSFIVKSINYEICDDIAVNAEEEYDKTINSLKKDINELFITIQNSVKLIKMLAEIFDKNDETSFAVQRLFGGLSQRLDNESALSKVLNDFKIKIGEII